MAKEKIIPEAKLEITKKTPVKIPKKVIQVGQGDSAGPSTSRATFPLTSSTPTKPKSQFTLPKSPMPAKSQSIPELRSVTPAKFLVPTLPVRKSIHRVSKPKKSITMLELRAPNSKSTISDQLNYAQILESLGPEDALDDKYRYLAYKTFCFMMKNAWKRAKDERVAALEKVAKLQTSVLKTKTQLHVIRSLYHIERQHFDTASVQLHDSKSKLNEFEAKISELSQKLKSKEVILQQFSNQNEKLRRNLDETTSKVDRLAIQLDKKRDENSQLKSDNDFLIKQRQEMEASMTARLNRYKEAFEDTKVALFDANQELDKLQPVIDELEMKKIELDEYHFINSLQGQEIDFLSTKLRKLEESLTLKHRLKLVWKCMTYKKERNWYLSVVFGTFLPALKNFDLVAVDP